MARKETYLTDVKKVILDGRANRGIFGGEEVLRMIYGGEVVFNRALYVLEVMEEVEVPATGVDSLREVLNVISYKQDYDNGVTEVRTEGGDFAISANSSDKERTGSYSIWQDWTGFRIDGTYTQKAREFNGYGYVGMLSRSVEYDEVEAWGGTYAPMVTVMVQLLASYSDGTSTYVNTAVSGSVSHAEGYELDLSGATINSTNGEISVPSSGYTEKVARNIFRITKMSGTFYVAKVNGTFSWDWVGQLNVVQKENRLYYEPLGYILSVSANPSEGILNTGGTSAISATAKQRYNVHSDANPTPYEEHWNVTAELSTNIGKFDETNAASASVTGDGSATLSLGDNTGGVRTATVTLSYGGESRQCTVSQNAVTYEFYAVDDAECNAEASFVYVSFVSTRNGYSYQPQKVSAGTGASVEFYSQSGSTFTYKVSVTANSSENARTIAITATQSRWDKDATATLSVTQAGKPVENRPAASVGGLAAYGNAARSFVTAEISIDATNTSLYNGGTIANVQVWLSTADDGTGTMVGSIQSLGSITVEKGKLVVKTLTFSGTAGYSELFLWIRYNTTETNVSGVEDYQPEE